MGERIKVPDAKLVRTNLADDAVSPDNLSLSSMTLTLGRVIAVGLVRAGLVAMGDFGQAQEQGVTSLSDGKALGLFIGMGSFT